MSRVLFLCTGNYYRSRYAEILFNHLAPTLAVPWRADSRGLMVDVFGVFNAGSLARQTRSRCEELAIVCPTMERDPLQLVEDDLRAATLVVCLKEAEHREMVRLRFPTWEARVEYWHIHDLGDGPVEDALAGIEREVRGLLDRLKATEPEASGEGRQRKQGEKTR